MNISRLAPLAALALASCGSQPAATPPARPPLQGSSIGGPFTLVDQNGRTVTDRQFAGKYRIMYFGYTFCPDVCPADMQNVGAGLRLLEESDPALAAKVVPIFVTVDPARDTPAVLKQFVSAFHPRMVGLTGSEAAIDRVAKLYAVSYRREPPAKGAEGYLVDHSRMVLLFGPDGKPLALVPVDTGAEQSAAALARWVQ